MPEGIVTRSWAHPRDAAGFACQWRAEVVAARALGRRVGPRYLELRYEQLVADPEASLREICDHIGLVFEPGDARLRRQRRRHARSRTSRA